MHPKHHNYLGQWHRQEPTEGERPSKRASFQRGLAEQRYRPKSRRRHLNVEQPGAGSSTVSVNSQTVANMNSHDRDQDGDVDDEDRQDILELWFAGQHGDIGGGQYATCRPVAKNRN